MLVPISWLKKYVPVTDSPHDLAHKLTMAGIEIGEVQVIGGDWDREKVVVGHVLKVDPHPNADRLSLPTVDTGDGGTATVVCGAPNVAAGQKIAFAREGAKLLSPRSGKVETLKRARIRGVESAGMVCSPLELGLGEDHDGILVLDDDAPVGTPLSDYLGDAVLDAEVTSNRPDCLSILGIAHEVAAITGESVTEPGRSYAESDEDIENQATIEIADPDLCYRYTATLITGVKIGPSPQWLKDALTRAGQRPINSVVDITNYVMLEYGQPLHAFDFDTCKDRTIIVRAARDGEMLTTLDGEERKLSPPYADHRRLLRRRRSRRCNGRRELGDDLRHQDRPAGVGQLQRSQHQAHSNCAGPAHGRFRQVRARNPRRTGAHRPSEGDAAHRRAVRRYCRQGHHRPVSDASGAADRQA